MKINVLGPVEMEAGGRLLDVGPRQRRAVLAVLAVNAGAPVSIQTLAERLWGPRTPQAPRSSLYAHISRLKQTLRQIGSAYDVPIALGRRNDGYVLEVDRRSVDLHRFQGLVGATSAVPAAGNERVARLREAIDLWRGPPLLTLSSEWAVQMRRSVESQFIGAAGSWAEEALQLGEAAAVADLLAQLVGAYPHAERLVALQMRALCLLGRTAEALRLFADTHMWMVEQLGTEPGPELRHLHVAVLRGEIGGSRRQNGGTPAEPAPGRYPGASYVPRQLPVGLSRLVGRSAELARVVDWLTTAAQTGSAAVLTVYGAAGVGKSALAVRAANRLAGQYPDGQLYLDLRGFRAEPALEPVEALTRLLLALGVAAGDIPEHPDDLSTLFRSMIADRRMLLVLDDAADTTQVRPLLLSGTGCGTIVTSRSPLVDLGDTGQLFLDTLAVGEAVEMIRQWVGAARVAAEPEAAVAIARLCECLPLALRIVGCRLATRPLWPLHELRERLVDERQRLDTLELDGVGFRASLTPSYRWLSRHSDRTKRAAAEAYTRLGASSEPALNRAVAARLLGTSEADAEQLMERLVDAQLLETPAPGVYRMRELLRLYAREQLIARRGSWLAERRFEGRVFAW